MLNGREASLPQRSYPRDSSSLTVVRMTYVSFRTEADRLSVRNLMLFVWDSSLRSRYVQNDSCLLLLSRRKEVTKKGGPPVIGYSCLPHRSPTGAAEFAPLKQSSPSFRLLPCSQQPDKCGHAFAYMKLAFARRVIECYESEILRLLCMIVECHSERGRKADEESSVLYWLRFFITLRSIQNDRYFENGNPNVIPSVREESQKEYLVMLNGSVASLPQCSYP